MEKTESTPAAPERLTITPEEQSTSVSFDTEGKGTPSSHSDSMTHDFDAPKDQNALSADDLAALEAGEELPVGEPEAATEKTLSEDGETVAAGDTVELPEWDPESEEVSAAYDAKYVTTEEDGTPALNFEAFNEQYLKDRGANEDGSPKRDIDEASRKYLKSRFGISDRIIDAHIQGLQAQEREAVNIFHGQFAADPVEGKAVYEKMFAWGKENFTPAQRERFNKGMQAGGEEAMEQVELLKTRFITKNPASSLEVTKAAVAAIPKPLGFQPTKVRAVSPEKNATANGGNSRGPQPFANAEEHRKAQSAALKLPRGEVANAIADVRARLVASTFYK